MLTEPEINALLERIEDETLDFKATPYDLSTEDGRLALVKDIVCMANTPRTASSHIILGVKKHADGKYDLWGVPHHPDEALLQSQFTERVYPIPAFRYSPARFRNVDLGIIEIPTDRRGPSAAIRDFGSALRQWQIYFGRGSKNDIATPADLLTILPWFTGTQAATPIEPGTPWDQLLRHTSGYSDEVTHVLVLSPNVADTAGFAALVSSVGTRRMANDT